MIEPQAPAARLPMGSLPAELAVDLVEASAELHDVARSRTADAGTYQYRFADLAAVLAEVRPVLRGHGLAHVQLVDVEPVNNQMRVGVRTMLIHRTGATYTSPSLMLVVPSTDAQRVGSAITYARRYSLMALLGIAGEDDDDGAQAQPRASVSQRSRPAVPTSNGAVGRTPAEAKARQLLNDAAPDVRTAIQRAFREHFGVSLSNLPRDRHAEALSFVIEQLHVPELAPDGLPADPEFDVDPPAPDEYPS
jgi:hypothetical protein